MQAKKKQELKKETWEISEILFWAQESLKVVQFITKKEEDDDMAYVKRNAFFVYSTSIYWRVIVIELCKLFSSKDTEQYNLQKFISKFKKAGHYGDACIALGTIIDWEEMLGKEKDIINNLLLQRDKIYAHKDRNSKTVANTVTLAKTKELIAVVQKILREIYATVFESSFMVDDPINPPAGNLLDIINILANEKKLREKPLRELTKQYGIEDEFKD